MGLHLIDCLIASSRASVAEEIIASFEFSLLVSPNNNNKKQKAKMNKEAPRWETYPPAN